jgi:hypothetical protein
MGIRKIGHLAWDFIFEKSLYVVSILFVALSVIDISNLNEYKFNHWGIVNFPLGKTFYYFCVILTIIFGIIGTEKANTLQSLEKDISKKGDKIIDLENSLNDVVSGMNDLFNSYLTLFVESLNFTHTERVSVYKVYENKFILIGRSSVNPLLSRPGRSSYPISEGLIGKAWAEGEFFVDDLPDPSDRSGTTYYNRLNALNHVPREVINNLKMPSRTFYIRRMNGFENTPKAIIVIESIRNNAFQKQEVINKLDGVKQPLVMFIEKNNGVNLTNNNDQEL